MGAVLVRLGGLLTALFTAVILGLHARTYDDGGLRDLLLPQECAAPCFLGIRPGVTGLDDALAILEREHPAHEQMEIELQYRRGSFPLYRMVNWSGYLLYPLERRGRMELTHDPALPDVPVDTLLVRVNSSLTLGDVYLSLGRPDDLSAGFWYHDLGTQVSLILHHNYAGGAVEVVTRHLCGLRGVEFWKTPVLSVRYSTLTVSDLRPIDLQTATGERACRPRRR
ncbi:MAG: hypothetical protein IT320_00030 [Anaerolineae bacterium]|nr:hypothetical protein [Anaerolineae bacterium]